MAGTYTTPGHSCFHSFRGFNYSVDRRKQYNNVSVDENIFFATFLERRKRTEAFENALVWTVRAATLTTTAKRASEQLVFKINKNSGTLTVKKQRMREMTKFMVS